MENSLFLGSIIGPYLLIIGLSFLLYSTEWVKLMKELEKNHTSSVIGMAIALIIGLTIIRAHALWDKSIWVVITLFGWVAFLKGLFYFLAPGEWIKGTIHTFASKKLIMTSGALLSILGAWLSYMVYLS
jgi:uncharacterized protein YjeT (DUF2065 family)